MSYRTLPPTPGGRRDRRLRDEARTRTHRHVGGTAVAVALAVGTVSSIGASDVASTWFGRTAPAATSVAPLAADDVAVEVTTVTDTNSVANATVEQPDFQLRSGSRRVVQEGSPGTELISYTVTLVNGVEVDRTPGISVLVTPPTDEIVAVGELSIPAATPVQQGSNRDLGQTLASQLYGWTGDEWACLDNLWSRESGWSHTSHNRSSGAYGIPQALPGDKMASFGSDWASNPTTQIKWGLNYIAGRYATPCGAWAFFSKKNWY